MYCVINSPELIVSHMKYDYKTKTFKFLSEEGLYWHKKSCEKGTWCPYCAVKNNDGAKNIIKSTS